MSENKTKTDALNDQITDSINAIRESIEKGGIDDIEAYSQQILAHSVGLALLNAVHQQQQRYILQNAITTAAAKAIIQADPKEALKFAQETFDQDNIASNITALMSILEEFTPPGSDGAQSNRKSETTPRSAARRKKAAAKASTATK